MNAEVQAVRELLDAWLAATSNGDLHQLLQLMSDDVVFMAQGREPFGKEEFAAGFQAGLEHIRIEAVGGFEEIVIVGDVAYARARLEVSVAPRAGGPAKLLAGNTLTVLRKQADGRWVIVRDANMLTPVANSAT